MDLYHIILINSLVFPLLNANEVAVSKESLSWYDAADSSNNLLNQKYISKHGWEFFNDVNFSTNGLWIGARAKLAPLISWEGCARWNSSCVTESLPAGSLGDCLKNCRGDSMFMLLKGDKCRCFAKNETCIERTTDPCENQCKNNPNDWCGNGVFGTEALYRTGPFGKTNIRPKRKDANFNCIFLQYTSFNFFMNYEVNCDEVLYSRNICKNNSGAIFTSSLERRNWFGALEACKEFNSHLSFDPPTQNSKPSEFGIWTSLRRSFSFQWTKKYDKEYSFCVSANLNKQSKLMLSSEDCNTHKRYLYWTGSQIAVSNIEMTWQEAAVSINGLLTLDRISKIGGWSSIADINFNDDGLWVAARAKYAPFVSWEGCAIWYSSCVTKTLSAGSIADCLEHCRGFSKYMLLKGDMCRCF